MKKTQQIQVAEQILVYQSGQNLERQAPGQQSAISGLILFLALSPGTLDRLSSPTAASECIQVVAIRLIPQGLA